MKLYGSEHVDVAKVTNNYGTLLQELGENEEALYFYERALSMLKKLRGEYNPQVLSILDNLSSLFRDMNLFDDALDVDAQADVIQQRLLLRVDHKNGTYAINAPYRHYPPAQYVLNDAPPVRTIHISVYGRSSPISSIQLF